MPHVLLRDVAEDDLPVFFEHEVDAVATELARVPSRDRDAFMAHWVKILADAAVVTKTVVGDGEVAGNVLSFARDGRRAVGYRLGREHWGRGITAATLAEFISSSPASRVGTRRRSGCSRSAGSRPSARRTAT